MIFDSIKNLQNYGDIFKDVIAFIASNDLKTIALGRYDISGDIYVNIQEYKSKPKGDNVCEAHKKYIDVQYMVSGGEKMFFGTHTEMLPKKPYNEELDVEHNNVAHVTECQVLEGWFCVFFPGEYHKPGICLSEPTTVRKALFKIKSKSYSG